jgi:hypothetical protein
VRRSCWPPSTSATYWERRARDPMRRWRRRTAGTARR